MSLIACPACRTPNAEFNAFCRVCSGLLTGTESAGAGIAADHSHAILSKGTVVSHYEVLDLIGAGAMGQVYRAFDRHLGRQVALKFLSIGLAGDRRARERMRREAQAASALDHPGIATIFEVAEHEGRPFIAMMLYEGETLAAVLSRGPLPIREAARIGMELASALATAHGAGIVHRDVKPANVILTRAGGVKLVDFGLAKTVASAETTALTRTGSILGTVAYMAPEQLTGEVVDHRADLWSLGVLLYEAFSGSLPIVGAGLAHRILTKDPVPLSAARRDVPRPLARLVMRLLEKDPARRIQTAKEVEEALRTGSSGSRAGSAVFATRARRMVAGSAAAIALGLVFTFAFFRDGAEAAHGSDGTGREADTGGRESGNDRVVHVMTVAPLSAFVPTIAAAPASTSPRPIGNAPAAVRRAARPVAPTASSAASERRVPLPGAEASFDGLGLPEKPF